MNAAVTSKEEILNVSRQLIQRQGWSAINIRSVAAACGVSVGAIYNYFDCKAALACAAVESVWREIFRRPEDAAPFQDAQSCVVWIYERLEQGGKQYPGFFTLHSLSFMSEEKADGKQKMRQTWRHIVNELCAVLKRDARVRADAFTERFTAETFAEILFSLVLSALLRQEYDPAAALEIIRRTVY